MQRDLAIIWQEKSERLEKELIDMVLMSSDTGTPIFIPDPDIPLAADLQQLVHTECAAAPEELTPDIVFAIIAHESNYQADAVGHNRNGTTDAGLGQINSCNWEWLAAEGIDIHTPEGNIKAIVRILSLHMEDYPLEQALAAYAVGEAGMLSGKGMWFAEEILKGDDVP